MKRYALILVAVTAGLLALPARADYQPKADRVTENVYAIVGPLGQRSAATQANYANQQMVGLERFLGERLKGTQPLPAPKTLAGDSATLDRYADLPAFRHLENYGDLHRANMNRAFTEFESQ